ncbi:regulatory protein RecX [Gorillibacterium sp. sgz5001074]|uniref:regulatory protein RecX n=1 Tax=Gorillibacterium sp. sgz5001074 TaxID=3446695 RepID=UPI003F675762
MEQENMASGSITMVERQKGNKRRYNIFIEGSYAFSVHEDIMIKHRLIKGEQVEREELEEILRDDERHQAYMEAIRYVGRRPRSKKEVELHLKEKGYEGEWIGETVKRLQEERVLDDGAFAKLWTEHRIMSQKKGRRWVEMELSQKGVDDTVISQAFGDIDPEEEYSAALEIGRKKWNITGGEGLEKKRKVMAFLLRRGYSSELVNRVLKEVAQTADLGDTEDESFF